ncbi:MAG: gephyrin-like molybdotransferase Glp [Acidimicrobiaceae bacterium]
MIPLDEARQYVLDRVARLASARVPLADAAGLVLAADVVAAEQVPPFANTAMDGFAVRAADVASVPVTLEVIGTVAAGSTLEGDVGPGQAARIMTGAPMPDGADAVVMVEKTTLDEAAGTVLIDLSVSEGNHVRRAGEDVEPGDLLFAAGTVLTAGHLGVLASVGVQEVECVRRPKVGVISTGDELVDDGRPLQPGEIRDSNRRTLLTLVAEAGWEAVDLGIAVDQPDTIRDAFAAGAVECDAILSSGGVSMGAFDYVKVVLDEIGDMRWMQIAIKPAKPFAFGLIGTTPVFGLPGNPVSSMVSFELFARAAIGIMAGHDDTDLPLLWAISEDSLGHGPDGKTHFLRVEGRIDDTGRWHVRRAGGQGSHQLTAMARADALALAPDGVEIEPGDEVRILPLR